MPPELIGNGPTVLVVLVRVHALIGLAPPELIGSALTVQSECAYTRISAVGTTLRMRRNCSGNKNAPRKKHAPRPPVAFIKCGCGCSGNDKYNKTLTPLQWERHCSAPGENHGTAATERVLQESLWHCGIFMVHRLRPTNSFH